MAIDFRKNEAKGQSRRCGIECLHFSFIASNSSGISHMRHGYFWMVVIRGAL